MKQLLTNGIVLTRTDYGEADRIVTLITPDQGKLRLMARGVRKIKSRAAGGIELFSVSEIGFMHGRGELGTLISARLITHYGRIVRDIERVQGGYELIKMLHKATEDQTEPEYFELLELAFIALDDVTSLELINVWFQAQLLKLGGHSPNLLTDVDNHKLEPNLLYDFDFNSVAFTPRPDGAFNADHIKAMRLLLSPNRPQVLSRIEGVSQLLTIIAPLISVMRTTYTRT